MIDSKFTNTTPWSSISVITALTLCAMIQFSIYFSSTYPFLLSLDPNVTENFYGLVVASYSLGQIIGSPILGWYSNKIKNVRSPIAIGLVLSFLGNFIYVSALVGPTPLAKYFVLMGRFIVGFGGSNVGVMRAFASMASAPNDRSRAIALINGGYALGNSLGPAIQLFFTPLSFPGIQMVGPVFLSIYTAPAFSACIINIIGLICLYRFFEERYAGLVDTKTSKDDKSSSFMPRYDILALLLCHLTTFSQRFTFTNLETLNPPLGMLMFDWDKKQVVKYIGLAHGATSLLTLFVNMFYFLFKTEKILNFRVQCIIAISGLLVFHLVTFSWPFLPGTLSSYTQAEYDIAIANGSELVGCNKGRFSWCDDVKPTNAFFFYGAYIIFVGLCFPVMQITINTLFSKILGPVKMGTQQGLLQMSGSFARLTGPIIVSELYSTFGPQAAWSLELLVLGINLIAWFPLYSRMVPLKFMPENNNLSTVKIQPIDSNRKLSVSSLSSDRSSYINTQRTNVN